MMRWCTKYLYCSGSLYHSSEIPKVCTDGKCGSCASPQQLIPAGPAAATWLVYRYMYINSFNVKCYRVFGF